MIGSTMNLAKTDLSEELQTYCDKFPFPSPWKKPELFVDQFVLGEDGLELVGLASQNGFETVTGSAADFKHPPLARAYFELLERISVVEAEGAPQLPLTLRTQDGKPFCTKRWPELDSVPNSSQSRNSRSNGVSVAMDWQQATQSAYGELVERDRILSSWFGTQDPRPLPDSKHLIPSSWQAEFDFELVEFPATKKKDPYHVFGAFCFPKRLEIPRGYGFGAARDREDAIDHAVKECAQSVGFLWGEEIPSLQLPFKATPDYHQDFYLQPRNVETLRQWINLGHKRYRSDYKSPEVSTPLFVEITPKHLIGKLVVVRAIDIQKMPLYFGIHEPLIPEGFPWELRIHPVA